MGGPSHREIIMNDWLYYALGCLSGTLVGLILGLVGGGGSILAVPLMVHLVGVVEPHVAIGTSALAVAANAAVSLAHHATTRTVKWRCGAMYALTGIFGAAAGSTLGRSVDGDRLLLLFACLMIIVGLLMFKRRHMAGEPGAQCGSHNVWRVLGYGLITGALSGFFGIGGGFLIVPGLVASTGMPVINAVGTSLVAVTAFGLTTAMNYALAGLVDWGLAVAFILGGAAGGSAGVLLAHRLSGKGQLTKITAILILVVSAYMIWSIIIKGT